MVVLGCLRGLLLDIGYGENAIRSGTLFQLTLLDYAHRSGSFVTSIQLIAKKQNTKLRFSVTKPQRLRANEGFLGQFTVE